MSSDSAIRVTLDIFSGSAQGKTFVFDKPGRYLFGSADEADIQVTGNSFVSRQHFFLEIAPPVCKILDISTNGTFVNGIRYGGKKAAPPNVPQAPGGISELELQGGDEIKIGKTEMKISLESEATCPECGKKYMAEAKDGVSEVTCLCVDCLEKKQYQPAPLPPGSEKEMGPITGMITRAEVEKNMAKSQTPPARPEKKCAASKMINIEDYPIESEIGRGYSGVMYKALKRSTGKTVALKKLAHAPESSKDFDAYLGLSHPNIAKLLDWGYFENSCYLASEFVEGEDLYRFCKMNPKGYLELDQAKPFMLQMLDGLAFAHTQSTLHGNLKPQNIFLVQDDQFHVVKVTDFGIAISPDPESIGMVPVYWPRERILQYPMCAPCDVFAIAAIFYEMLTGSWLREGFKEMFTLCRKQGRKPGLNHYMQVILSNPVIPIRDRNPEIPEATAAVIDHALVETLPDDREQAIEILEKIRYPNAGAFRQALAESFTQ